jgi:hypothetical protein
VIVAAGTDKLVVADASSAEEMSPDAVAVACSELVAEGTTSESVAEGTASESVAELGSGSSVAIALTALSEAEAEAEGSRRRESV